MINRRDASGKVWSPKKDARVCSLHFINGRPTPENLYPCLNLGYEGADRKVKRMLFSDQVNTPQPKRKKVGPTPVEPVILPDSTSDLHNQPAGQHYQSSSMPMSDSTDCGLDPEYPDPPVPDSLPPSLLKFIPCHWTYFTSFLLVIQCLWIVAFSYHTRARHLFHQVKSLTTLLAEEKRKVSRLSAEVDKLKAAARENSLSKRIMKTDADVTFFPGIGSKQLFQELLAFVAPYIHRRWCGTVSLARHVRKFMERRGPQRQLSTSDEFLLTLMKLRLLNKDLASRFNISPSLCSRISFSWIRGLSTVLGTLVFMPDKDEIAASKPARFNHLPDIHSIIDCTEVFIETPKDLYLQAATWSDYKHHNTLKILVAVAPNSSIVFASKAYCGRAGDKAITLDCGFLDEVPAYSMLMADKGFNIANECAGRYMSLHVPPGRRGHTQMTSAAVRKTKRIANLRIIVEQVIRQLKTFRILNTELPLLLCPILTTLSLYVQLL